MKKLYYIYLLLFLSPLSYGNTNPLIAAETSEKVMSQNELTAQEKIELKNTIISTIKVINDNDAMEGQMSVLGEGRLFLPKSPKAPILMMDFDKNELFTISFKRVNEQSSWSEAFIYFPPYKRSLIETKFNESDFTQGIGLTFDKLSEHTVKHSASNGMEAYETKEYTFD